MLGWKFSYAQCHNFSFCEDLLCKTFGPESGIDLFSWLDFSLWPKSTEVVALGMMTGTHKTLFGTLANSIRLDILLSLRKGEKNVTQLVNELDMKQSTVSHNLRKLLEERLIQSRSDGPFRYFSLNAQSMGPVLELMEKHAASSGKKLKLVLEETRMRFRTVLKNAPVSVFGIDAKGVIQMMEGRVYKIIGLDPEKLIGKSAFDAYPEHSDARKNIKRMLAGEEFSTTFSVAGRTFITHHSPLTDGKGRFTGCIGVSTDITEQWRATEELRLLKEMILALASAPDLDIALRELLGQFCAYAGAAVGQAWVLTRDGSTLDCSSAWHGDETAYGPFRETSRQLSPSLDDRFFITRAWMEKEIVWIEDFFSAKNFFRGAMASRAGLGSGLAVPVVCAGQVLAVLEFFFSGSKIRDARICDFAASIIQPLGAAIAQRRRGSAQGTR